MSEFDWKVTISLNIELLKIPGLWPTKNKFQKRKAMVSFLIFFVLVVACQTAEIFFLEDLTALIGVICILLAELLFAVKFYCMMKNQKQLASLMDILEETLFKPNEQQLLQVGPNLKNASLIFKTFLVMCCASVVIFILSPLLNGDLPYPAWYPYDSTRSPLYEFTYLHQALSYTYICVNHMNVDILIAALNVYISNQFDILCDNLRNLHKGTNLKTKFVRCVRHHQLILTFVQLSNHFVNWIVLAQFGVSSTVTAVTLLQLTIVSPRSSEFQTFLTYGIAAVSQIFMYCWFSNETKLKSLNVPNAIYESEWMGFPVSLQKDLVFFILRTQHPVTLGAFNIFELSLESFMKILKTAWSYFALLQQVSKK